MKPIKVALLGIGTVGSGVFNVLRRNQAEISARVGRGIEIVLVADRNLAHAKSITGDAVEVIDDAFAAVSRPDIDVVVELIGGYTVAKELVLKAIENGKHVVTANKALLAVHGTEIFTPFSAPGTGRYAPLLSHRARCPTRIRWQFVPAQPMPYILRPPWLQIA